jgi:hypothetical protein
MQQFSKISLATGSNRARMGSSSSIWLGSLVRLCEEDVPGSAAGLGNSHTMLMKQLVWKPRGKFFIKEAILEDVHTA